MTMNQEVKKLWVDALRSGDYEQGTLSLRTKNNCHCCLGVLTELGVAAGVIPAGKLVDRETFPEYKYGSAEEGSSLPHEIVAWSEVNASRDGDILLQLGHEKKSLIALNDSGVPFREIADLIEANL